MKGPEFFRHIKERLTAFRKPESKTSSSLGEKIIPQHPLKPEKSEIGSESVTSGTKILEQWIHILSAFWEEMPSSIEDLERGGKPSKSLAFDIKKGLTPGTTEIYNTLVWSELILTDPSLFFEVLKQPVRENNGLTNLWSATADEVISNFLREGKLTALPELLKKAEDIAKLPRSQQISKIKEHLVEFHQTHGLTAEKPITENQNQSPSLDDKGILFPDMYDDPNKERNLAIDAITGLPPGTCKILYLLTIYEMLLIDPKTEALLRQQAEFEGQEEMIRIYGNTIMARASQLQNEGTLTNFSTLIGEAQEIARLSPDQQRVRFRKHIAQFKQAHDLT